MKYVRAFFLSFASAEMYREVARQWRGVGLGYLFLALAVLEAPEAIKIHVGFTRWVDVEAAEVVDQIPAITVTKGEVTTDVETPYFIRNPKLRSNQVSPTAEYLAVVDLTGKYTSLEEVNASALLTRKSLIIRKNPYETQTYDLSQVQSFRMDKARVRGWLGGARNVLALAFYLLVLVFSFLYRIAQIALYGALGLLLARWARAELPYAALMRLAAVAITPALVANTIVVLFVIMVPVWWLICFVLAMGYLFFAVKTNAKPQDGSGMAPVKA